MNILLCYDISTINASGRRRLRKIAKLCEDYGQRVQFSVFECIISPSDYVVLKNEIQKILDEESDSIRIYHLHKNWSERLEILGNHDTYNPEEDVFVF